MRTSFSGGAESDDCVATVLEEQEGNAGRAWLSLKASGADAISNMMTLLPLDAEV